MNFPTTLIIGLGGVGCRVVEGIYRKFSASNPTEMEKRNVAFLCLDTDANDIKERQKVMPKDCIVKTSSDMSSTIGAYIDRIKGKTTVLDWFDTKSKQLTTMSLNDGAAQVRMASRLAAISAIDENKFRAIDNSIKNLLKTEPERHAGNNIKIHIVCSLAGGTGAGSFLQAAYYVKNAMREQNADAPKITGYFLLADVLCEDSNMGFSDDQKENIRSNTYACMKELLAFSSGDHSYQTGNIQFEYRLGQRDKQLPAEPPYDTCFVVDYFGVDGGNLIKEVRYEEQTVEFVYLNAFDPIGDNLRKNAINDIRQKIDRDGAGRFASFGVSKLVYPVDDLMAYFACQRVVDNLSGTWLRIDKDFEERMAEYKQNIDQGVRAEEPNRGKHFMQQVEALGTIGAGREGVEFRKILESTRVPVEGRDTGRLSKASLYLEGVKDYVDLLIKSSKELTSLYAYCTAGNPNFTKNTGADNDLAFVARRERELEEYRNAVMAFIDSNKSVAIKQCFLVDHDQEGYVSKNPQADKNHLNTYILKKEKELHPLAVRYLLYDVQDQLNTHLDKHKANIKSLGIKINEGYKKLFDDPETKERVETARERLKKAKDKSSGLLNKSLSFFGGQDSYKAEKENYESLSSQQAENIHKYCAAKLLEETYAGLLAQIKLLIEEEENFFKSLPTAIGEVNNKLRSLLKMHDANNDPCVSYVLASEKMKRDIYDDVISVSDSPFFPPEMSAALYRSMYHNAVAAIATMGSKAAKRKDSKTKKDELAEANRRIIADCIGFQEEIIRDKNREYSEMNVISALRAEAMHECYDNEEKAREYMLQKFHAFRDRAEIWGPDSIDNSIRYINAWGLNPACIEPDVVTGDEMDELFGDTNVGTNVKTAATRIASACFSPYEIIRVNAVTLLTIEKNFKGFLSKEKTALTGESLGNYYVAYKDVVDRMNVPNSKTYSPHLDKHWHLPAFMPNIGFTYADEVRQVFRAMYWGLLLNKFKFESRGGDNYWKFVGDISSFIKDVDGNMILTGNSLKYALDRLFMGLTSNPSIVSEVLKDADTMWSKAKDQWLQKETDDGNELDKMKKSKIVQSIATFEFGFFPKAPKAKGSNWFSLLQSKENLQLHRLMNMDGGLLKTSFFSDLMERLIYVFGPSSNTRKVCEYIIRNVDKANIDHARALLDSFDEQNRFQPNE